MELKTIPFGYDAGAADRIQKHVDRINEQHSKEMFSKKQLLDLLDEIDKQIYDPDQYIEGPTKRDLIKQSAVDLVRQRLLRNEL